MTDTDRSADRIKLAEAMGWTRTKYSRWRSPCGTSISSYPPNPFTDANDDYAVLEWMRDHEDWHKFWMLPRMTCMSNDYQIGDYARAALSVLSSEDSDE